MIKNQTKYEIEGMTTPYNVIAIVKKLESHPVCKQNDNQQLIGESTQKQLRNDLKKVTILVRALYALLKIYGYDDKIVKDSKYNKYKSKDESKQLSKNDLIIKIQRDQRQKTGLDKIKLRNLFLQYVFHSGPESWKDLYKYKINAFFSYTMGQEVPPLPKDLEVGFEFLRNPATLFVGRANKFFRRYILPFPSKAISFAQSVAQSKKGAPPVSYDTVQQAEIKCFEHLTAARRNIPPFVINDSLFEHVVNQDTMMYQLRRTVRECIFDIPTWDELAQPFVPSTNSNYNMSRTNLGGVGAFLANQRIQTHLDYWRKEGRTFLSKALGKVILTKELSTLYGQAGVQDQLRIDTDSENVGIKETIGLHYDGSDLETYWKNTVYPLILDAAIKEEPKTIVIGLPEPLKVRCITAGPPMTYMCLKPIQKWLWRKLKNLPNFQLIGTPVTEDIVRNILGKLGPGEEFISGDYKASTDNLHSWVSETLLDELNNIWQELGLRRDNGDLFDFHRLQLVELMKRALTGHIILHPSKNEIFRKDGEAGLKDEDFATQKEGQLMGSIISFPFLCLANAAMCRWAMEITDTKNYSLVRKFRPGYEPCRLLINGDDCVFPGIKGDMFFNWQRITAYGGLESSVGKTFRSDKFLTINSVQYEYKIADWEDYSGIDNFDYSFNEVKYVNLGLVYAQKKDGIRGKRFYRLGAIHRDLERTCPPELFVRATKEFLKEAKKPKFMKVLAYTTKAGKQIYKKVEDPMGSILLANVPYYMPEWLGGLGLIPTHANHSNNWDLKVASCIRGNRVADFKIRTIKDEPLWQFHRLVDKSLEDYKFLDEQHYLCVGLDNEERLLSDEYQKLYTLCVVQQLLTKISTELVQEVDVDADKCLYRAHIHNCKVWRKLRSDPALSGMVFNEPAAIYEDLLQERKDFYLSCYNIAKVPSTED